jgi:hypothetical protein
VLAKKLDNNDNHNAGGCECELYVLQESFHIGRKYKHFPPEFVIRIDRLSSLSNALNIAMSALPTAIFRRPTPEEAELLFRRAELAALRASLAAREAELAHLRAHLASFKARYIRQVGVLYLQLDEWEDRIAQLNGTPTPTPAPEPEPATTPTNNQPRTTNNLKSLFREVAKRIHPDRARNPLYERHRTYLMAQANDAYLRNDAAVLHRMLNGHDPTAEIPSHAANLALTLAQIQQSLADIAAVDAETAALAQSEMAQLQQRSILAATRGQDLLAELAARVKGRISLAMRRYEFDLARSRRNQAPFDPSPLLSAETAGPR